MTSKELDLTFWGVTHTHNSTGEPVRICQKGIDYSVFKWRDKSWMFMLQIDTNELSNKYREYHPHKFVTLKTVTGDEVRCEWVHTHTGVASPSKYMLLPSNPVKTSFCTIDANGSVGHIDDMDLYTPITPPAPENPALEYLAEIQEQFDDCHFRCLSKCLSKLETLIKEQTNG